jgi:hypothetical protein
VFYKAQRIAVVKGPVTYCEDLIWLFLGHDDYRFAAPQCVIRLIREGEIRVDDILRLRNNTVELLVFYSI